MSYQYLRRYSLQVGPPGGGVELAALRFRFEVRRGDTQTPNSCDVRVYNLSDQTANLIRQPEFTRLQLKVGYQGQPLGLIFQGSIKQLRKGREDQKNNYLDITAADGDEAYNFAAMAVTLSASANTAANSIKALVENMARATLAPSPTTFAQQQSPSSSSTSTSTGQSLTVGPLPKLPEGAQPRGRTYYGICADVAREIAQATNCKWSIQDGAFTLIPMYGYLTAGPAAEIIVISPSSGLIGVPEQTQNGLALRVLMNPAIKIGQRIRLDSKDINKLRFGLDLASQPINQWLAKSSALTAADGVYYVMRAEHFGDTRGTDWYTDLTCLAVNAMAPEQVVNYAVPAMQPQPNPGVPRT